MKVFFTGPQNGKKLYEDNYRKIYDYIHELGYEELDDSLLKTSTSEFYEQLDKGGKEAHVDHYNHILELIKTADINVFECSIPSLGIGYQITKSLELGKPTIVFYHEGSINHIFFSGSEDDKLILKKYNEKNLKKVIKEAFEVAKERRDKRFNFFISPKLLDFLEKVSKKEGVTKSKWIRDLIVREMRNQSI